MQMPRHALNSAPHFLKQAEVTCHAPEILASARCAPLRCRRQRAMFFRFLLPFREFFRHVFLLSKEKGQHLPAPAPKPVSPANVTPQQREEGRLFLGCLFSEGMERLLRAYRRRGELVGNTNVPSQPHAAPACHAHYFSLPHATPPCLERRHDDILHIWRSLERAEEGGSQCVSQRFTLPTTRDRREGELRDIFSLKKTVE